MGDDVLVVQVLQSIEDARVRTLGILLDVQDGTKVVCAIGGIDDEVTGLGREHVPADREIILHRGGQHRNRLIDAVDQVAEQLQRFGEDHAVFCFVHAHAIRRVIANDSFNVASQFQQLFDGLFLLCTQLLDVGRLLDEALTGHDRTIDHRQVQLVLHDALRGQHAHVLVGHVLVEALLERALALQRAATADIVHPEGDIDEIRCAQGLKQPVERIVPVLQFPLLSTDKRQPFQMPRQQVITARGLHHIRGYMRRQGNEFADGGVWAEHTTASKEVLRRIFVRSRRALAARRFPTGPQSMRAGLSR